MEATSGESPVLIVGRYSFSKKSFDKAVNVIREGMRNEGWLVIDEIGPMELRGEGFNEVIKTVLSEARERQTTLLVVRDGLVEKVRESYQISNAIVVNGVAGLG